MSLWDKTAPPELSGYLTKKLETQGFKLSKYDPCLFLGNGILVITYVVNILIYARTQDKIDDLFACLKADDIDIRKEDTAEGYIGLKVTYDVNKITLT